MHRGRPPGAGAGRRVGRLRGCLAAVVLAAVTPAAAQDSVTIRTDLLFYGDNTEFSNLFREGDTLLGSWGQVFVELQLNARVQVRGGLFGNWRNGNIRRVGQLSPVLALVVGDARQRFVFGTLETVRREHGTGPDLTGPHGLLPPLQVETLAFTRPFEAGLQWIVAVPRLTQDVWLHWQKLNTPRQRERFDAGVSGRLALVRGLGVPYAWHLVHRGGQRYAAGPVTDSHAGGAGLDWMGRAGAVDQLALEAIVLASRFVPDREDGASSRSGRGLFLRLAVREGPWRAHAIAWRGDDYVAEEGDPNYWSVRLDGTAFTAVRDYAEAGLTRVFRPASQVEIEASARTHRVEGEWGYSYRLLARVPLAWRVK